MAASMLFTHRLIVNFFPGCMVVTQGKISDLVKKHKLVVPDHKTNGKNTQAINLRPALHCSLNAIDTQDACYFGFSLVACMPGKINNIWKKQVLIKECTLWIKKQNNQPAATPASSHQETNWCSCSIRAEKQADYYFCFSTHCWEKML